MSEEGKVKLKKNGDITITQDGSTTIIAKYDAKTGTLEFATKEYSNLYYNQATVTVGTVAEGKEVSANKIKRICVKGDAPAPENLPKRPKLGPMGDAAKEIVEYYLKYDLPQAITRYGIYVDADGKPIKRKVRRVVENTFDMRNTHTDDDLEWIKSPGSLKSREKTPIAREREVIETEGIIARRATEATFSPNEVIGGFDPDEDYVEAPVGQEDEE